MMLSIYIMVMVSANESVFHALSLQGAAMRRMVHSSANMGNNNACDHGACWCLMIVCASWRENNG